MDFGYCLDGYLVHSLPEAKGEIYKAFSPFSVKAAQGEVRDKESNFLVTLQKKIG